MTDDEHARLKRRRTDETSSDDSDDAARAAAVLLDDEHDTASSSSMTASVRTLSPGIGPPAIRDPQYYFEDGSIILRVENTLFKVHRTILSRDNSLFSAMFSLPQQPSSTEGLSDSHALLLPGEKADEFKDFLWVLYALPHELRAIHSPGADLDRLINIAHKAAHYAFKSIETWILDAIEELVGRKPCPILAPLAPHAVSTATTATAPTTHNLTTHNIGPSSISIPAPSTPPCKDGIRQTGAQLTRLVRLAQTCGHTRLLDTLIKLLTGLMGLSLQFAYLAISLADELDLRALRGAAYLEIMSKDVYRAVPLSPDSSSDDSSTRALVPGELDSKGRLLITRAQEHRLLAGYYRLTSAWERIRTKPPAFEHAASCGATWHQHGCTQSWLEFWKEKSKADGVLALGLADACGRLKVIQKEFERWGSATYMHHDCRQAARRAIGDKLRSIEGRLPDYFSDEGMTV